MRFGAFVPQGWRLDLAGIEVEQHWPTMLETHLSQRVSTPYDPSGMELFAKTVLADLG